MTHHFTMPSEDEVKIWVENHQDCTCDPSHPLYDDGTCWYHLSGEQRLLYFFDWLRDRMKPVERLSDEELHDAAAIGVKHLNDFDGESFDAWRLGYRAAELRILGMEK